MKWPWPPPSMPLNCSACPRKLNGAQRNWTTKCANQQLYNRNSIDWTSLRFTIDSYLCALTTNRIQDEALILIPTHTHTHKYDPHCMRKVRIRIDLYNQPLAVKVQTIDRSLQGLAVSCWNFPSNCFIYYYWETVPRWCRVDVDSELALGRCFTPRSTRFELASEAKDIDVKCCSLSSVCFFCL